MKTKNVILLTGAALSLFAIYAMRSIDPQQPVSSVCVVATEPAPTICDWDVFTEAMINVESRGNPKAVGSMDDVGVLQIRPIMVMEANRILGREVFIMDDRYDRELSILIFNAVQGYHNPSKDLRRACYIWNSGGGDEYYNKVMKEYDALTNNKKM